MAPATELKNETPYQNTHRLRRTLHQRNHQVIQSHLQATRNPSRYQRRRRKQYQSLWKQRNQPTRQHPNSRLSQYLIPNLLHTPHQNNPQDRLATKTHHPHQRPQPQSRSQPHYRFPALPQSHHPSKVNHPAKTPPAHPLHPLKASPSPPTPAP